MNTIIYTIYFFRFHIYTLINGICFSLSDLFQSVWRHLGPSTSQQMTQFQPFYGWVILHYIFVSQLPYPFPCWWTFRLLCVLAVVNSAAVNTGVQVSFWIMVFSDHMPSSGLTGSHERYSIFLGRQNQYCENDCTNKWNLQIQCDPYQITNGIFHRTK